MLDKVAIGAIVSVVVTALGIFGVTIPEEMSVQIAALIVAIIAIVTQFTTAYAVTERQKNVDKLVTK